MAKAACVGISKDKTAAGPSPLKPVVPIPHERGDMNQLFEEFIAEFIRRELREVWQSRGWTFHAQSGTRHLLCDETGTSRFKLVPDIRFATATGKNARSERNLLGLS